ncbi:MAG: biotin/lipoyl-containing protein, partial [Thiohalocapsa sp.]
EEIPKVREDLGYIALVTPTSQIVGSQSVLNVLTGERYKSITNETAGVLKGAYGSTPAPVNKELQARVLGDEDEPITCRPADNLNPEMDKLTTELEGIANKRKLDLAGSVIDDVLIYSMFPQVGLKFLENRNNPAAFELPPWEIDNKASTPVSAVATPVPTPVAGPEDYRIEVNGKSYDVRVSPQGSVESMVPTTATASVPTVEARMVESPLAGNIVKVHVNLGQHVDAGDVVVVLEAMKMETEVRAPSAGSVTEIRVKEGDAVSLGAALLVLG